MLHCVLCTFHALQYGVTGRRGCGANELDHPRGCALDTLGDELYVVDSQNSRVLVLNSRTGALVRVLGQMGTDAGSFIVPFDVAVVPATSRRPHGPVLIAVSEINNARVQLLDGHTGECVRIMGVVGKCDEQRFGKGLAGFDHPTGLAFHGNRLLVADRENNRLQVFDWTTGDFLCSLTGMSASDAANPIRCRLDKPQGLCVHTTANLVYVCDRNNARILVLSLAADRWGQVCGYFGSRGALRGQFQRPGCICIDPDRGDVFVTDLYQGECAKISVGWSGTARKIPSHGETKKEENLSVSV